MSVPQAGKHWRRRRWALDLFIFLVGRFCGGRGFGCIAKIFLLLFLLFDLSLFTLTFPIFAFFFRIAGGFLQRDQKHGLNFPGIGVVRLVVPSRDDSKRYPKDRLESKERKMDG